MLQNNKKTKLEVIDEQSLRPNRIHEINKIEIGKKLIEDRRDI